MIVSIMLFLWNPLLLMKLVSLVRQVELELPNQLQLRHLEERIRVLEREQVELINVPVPEFEDGDPADIIHDFQQVRCSAVSCLTRNRKLGFFLFDRKQEVLLILFHHKSSTLICKKKKKAALQACLESRAPHFLLIFHINSLPVTCGPCGHGLTVFVCGVSEADRLPGPESQQVLHHPPQHLRRHAAQRPPGAPHQL